MGKRRDRSNAAPEVAPLDVDGVRTVAAVTVAWAAAVVVLVFFREQLVDDGRGWWLWTGLAGVGFGLLALEYTRKRRDAYLEEAASEDATTETAPSEVATPETARFEESVPGMEVGAASAHGEAAVPSVDPEDYRVTGPITAERPVSAPAAPSHERPDETTGHGGRRRARRGRRAADADTSPGSRSDEASSTGPVTDPGTDPGAYPGVRPGLPIPNTEAPSALSTSPAGSPDESAARHTDTDAGGRVTGEHAVPPPEFDTDVRAWLDLSEDEHPVTNYDTTSTRPIPPTRPPMTPPEPNAGPNRQRSAPESSDTGELPPSTPRSAPYPGPAREAPVSQESRPSPPAPSDSGPAHSDITPAGGDTTPAGGDPAPEVYRSRGLSVDSEFFDAVGPTSSTSAYSDGYDADAPLLDDTLGGTQRPPRQVDDTAEDELDAGSTGTDGPYRGRRARRPDSG